MSAPIPVKIAAFERTTPQRAAAVIGVGSCLVLVGLLAIIYGHGRAEGAPEWVAYLPVANAAFNATSAVLLVLAYRAIRRGDVGRHVRFILGAVAAEALFLVSYVTYHAVHGDTRFAGHGVVRPLYFLVLISHVVLSAVALPLIFGALFLALSGRFGSHRKLARYTFPVWLYVSVTGVLVFVLLRAYA